METIAIFLIVCIIAFLGMQVSAQTCPVLTEACEAMLDGGCIATCVTGVNEVLALKQCSSCTWWIIAAAVGWFFLLIVIIGAILYYVTRAGTSSGKKSYTSICRN